MYGRMVVVSTAGDVYVHKLRPGIANEEPGTLVAKRILPLRRAADGMSPHTRRGVLKGIAAGGVAAGFATPAGANQPERCFLNWRRELSSRTGDGRAVINATQAVVNDIDSGFNGFWAYDDYRRLIQVWAVDDRTFEAVVMYNGQFDGVAGQNSPGQDGGDELSGDEDGTLHGGYAATVEGELLDEPAWPRRGFVGTTDYEGDVIEGTRPGAIRWQNQYFEDPEFAFEWWGWIYRGGRCGTWVNAKDGSCGDISCD